MYKLGLTALLLCGAFLTGCNATDEEKELLKEAQVDLEQLADQIIITYPANGAIIDSPSVTVRADIPAAAEAQEVTLYVDGIEIAKDSDGAPWEIEWPTYYWADGSQHTLLLKTITGGGNEVRNNQQFQVTVDTTANNALQVTQELDGTVLVNSNSLLVEFNELSNATNYELTYSNEYSTTSIESTSSPIEINDLNVGTYEVKYRSSREYSEFTTLTGPWSAPITIEVTAPELPVLNTPSVTLSESSYNILLSWEDLGAGNTYTIYFTDTQTSTQLVYDDISENQLEIENLEIGTYEWQLMRANAFGHESAVSDSQKIQAGVFTTILGGSKNDRAKQIIPTIDNGYVVLGHTNSSEISENVDSQGDDWIIKLDSEGTVTWQYISSANGRDRFNDVAELSDGSIILVGQDWNSKKAVALKLDQNGNIVWETYYRPDNLSGRFDFLDIVEINEKIYISSAEWGESESCAPCTKRLNYYLHTLDAQMGTTSSPVFIPSIANLNIQSVTALEKTRSGAIILSGFAMPQEANQQDHHLGGAYIQILNSNYTQDLVWNNVGSLEHDNVGAVLELYNGDLAIIGNGITNFGSEPIISTIKKDGSDYKSYTAIYGQEYYGGKTISSDNTGNIFGLFFDLESQTPTFNIISANSTLTAQVQLIDQKSGAPIALLKNNDSTFTVLMNKKRNDTLDYDIAVTKTIINSN